MPLESRPYRISFLGIPCSGKSYHAIRVCTKLKAAGQSVEFIEEPFKDWAFEKRAVPNIGVQIEGFGIQLRRELSRLESGVGIITDSGLVTVSYYLHRITPHIHSFTSLEASLANLYRTVNILLPPMDRDTVHSVGRWEEGVEEEERERRYREFTLFLDRFGMKYHKVDGGDKDEQIRHIIRSELGVDYGDS